jgi:Family of unknown function (DUF6523)
VRKEKEDIFEYGHCLKAFPDEEIKIIKREAEKKNFFSNWYVALRSLTGCNCVYDV